MRKIFKYSKIENIDKKKVIKSLNNNHFVILRGLFKKKEVIDVLRKIKKNFNHKEDKIRSLNQYNLIKTNYQRFMFGMSGGIKGALKTNPRYFRVFYNPLWCDDIYSGRDILKRLTHTQNYFYKLDKNYGINEKKTKHELFVASRFQHYPKGGGFLAAHKDIAAIRTAKKLGINLFYNFLLIMTKKGKDYKSGGGFVVKDNKIIDYENIAEVGDVVIYNSKTEHGVLDIDPNIFPDKKFKEGRYIALSTLFKW
ncbi:hypothetical protein ABXT43_00730 [Candidatus Pelagibacter sp. Uisw_114]|tara:strand:- start:24487 stop:25245 length:759 start_codon:yes stop_codon:yes gene_type:complete